MLASVKIGNMDRTSIKIPCFLKILTTSFKWSSTGTLNSCQKHTLENNPAADIQHITQCENRKKCLTLPTEKWCFFFHRHALDSVYFIVFAIFVIWIFKQCNSDIYMSLHSLIWVNRKNSQFLWFGFWVSLGANICHEKNNVLYVNMNPIRKLNVPFKNFLDKIWEIKMAVVLGCRVFQRFS